MKKYLIIFQQSFSQYIAYRLQVLLNIIQGFLTPALMLLALTYASPATSIVASSLVPYYLIISFIYPVTNSQVDQEMDELAEKGELYHFLTRPLRIYNWLIVKNFSEKLIPVLSVLPLLGAILLILPGANVVLSFGTVLITLISLIMAFVLSFNISYLIGLFCFWFDEFWAVSNLKFVLISFFSGSILPYTFFPDWLSRPLSFTPFPYLASWFPRVLQGGSTVLDFVLILFWILVSFAAIQKLEALAIRHYSYVGG